MRGKLLRGNNRLLSPPLITRLEIADHRNTDSDGGSNAGGLGAGEQVVNSVPFSFGLTEMTPCSRVVG
jgi:hypothetical protein